MCDGIPWGQYRRVTVCGPDGRRFGENQTEEPLIIDPGTSVHEAMLLLKIHREGISAVLPKED
jgi:hypothetical protein